jgi:hypothetical protein
MIERNKKYLINEGRHVKGGAIYYGGFPRLLNEEGVVSQFNDSDDKDPKDEKTATTPDFGELDPIDWGAGHTIEWGEGVKIPVPSAHLARILTASNIAGTEHFRAKEAFELAPPYHFRQRRPGFEGTEEGKRLGARKQQLWNILRVHPHYEEYRKGHPETRFDLSDPADREAFEAAGQRGEEIVRDPKTGRPTFPGPKRPWGLGT